MSELIKIEHAGVEYLFDPNSTAEPEVEVGKDYRDHNGMRLIYEYELRGAHIGPPIKVLMINPQEENDEYGWNATWEELLWADDERPVESIIMDWYDEALSTDLAQIIQDTWW